MVSADATIRRRSTYHTYTGEPPYHACTGERSRRHASAVVLVPSTSPGCKHGALRSRHVQLCIARTRLLRSRCRQYRVQTDCMLFTICAGHVLCATALRMLHMAVYGLNACTRSQIEIWMTQAGLTAWTDAIGNVHGELRSSNASAPTVVLGSHYDTVLDAGKFDGALGVIASIAAVKALALGLLHDASWDVAAGAWDHRRRGFVVAAPCALSVCKVWKLARAPATNQRKRNAAGTRSRQLNSK